MNPELLDIVKNMKQLGLGDEEIKTKLSVKYPPGEITECLDALQDMRQRKSLNAADDNTDPTPAYMPLARSRVIERKPQLKFWAVAPLLPLILMLPYFISALSVTSRLPRTLMLHHDKALLATTGLYVWSALMFIAAITTSFVIFVARKETTITRWIYFVVLIDGILFALYTVLSGSIILLLFGSLQLYFYWWISKKFGVLSQN